MLLKFVTRGKNMLLIKEQISHWCEQHLIFKDNEDVVLKSERKLFETKLYTQKLEFMWKNKAKDIFGHSRIQSLKSIKLRS